jgi:hypothetical protein
MRWHDVVVRSLANGKLERIFRLRLETFDWNCQQHITPRFTEAEISQAIAPIKKAPLRKHRFDLNEAINEVIVLARSAIAENEFLSRPA